MNNKKLEELFDLPLTYDEDEEDEPAQEPITATEIMTIKENTLGALDKIEHALPMVKNLDASDQEMDELAALSTQTFKDLIDLGMNVEARFSAEIFHAASNFMNHAINAKNAKLAKNLKKIELQLKHAKLQSDLNPEEGKPIEGQVLDRNELMDLIKKAKKTTNT